MKEYIESMEILEKAIHTYKRLEEKKRDFGLGYDLSMKEIHTIQYIGDCPWINLKTLASRQGVTKGAASQMISRLVQKGLVSKEKSPRSDAEVVLSLTKEGKRAYKCHESYHQKELMSMQSIADSYSDEEWRLFSAILADMIECMMDVSHKVLGESEQ